MLRRICASLLAAALLLAVAGCWSGSGSSKNPTGTGTDSAPEPGGGAGSDPATEPPGPAPQPPDPPAPPPEPEDGPQQSRQVLNAFLSGRQAGRMDLVDPWLTAHARTHGGIGLSSPTERIAGYRAWLEPKPGEPYRYRVQLLYSYPGQAYSRYMVEFVTVKRTGTTYLVDHIEYYGQREAVAKESGKKLWLKWLGREQEIFAVEDLPAFFKPYPHDGPLGFAVGKTRFSAVAIAPDGKQVAFSSGNTMGMLGLLTIGFDDESSIVSAPLMEGLDLFINGRAREMLFSPDGQHLVVVSAHTGGKMRLHVWDVPQRKKLALGGFPEVIDPYQVQEPSWTASGKLLFTIQAGDTATLYTYDPAHEEVSGP